MKFTESVTSPVENVLIAHGIWGKDHAREGGEASAAGRCDRLVRKPFPSYLVTAGFYMEPVELHPYPAPSRSADRRLYKFVLPLAWDVDLGVVSPSPGDGLLSALFRGYAGNSIRPWLLGHIDIVIGHLAEFDADSRYSPPPISSCRYVFDRATHVDRRNLALLVGQLERFGGEQLMIALKLSGADRLLRQAGYSAWGAK